MSNRLYRVAPFLGLACRALGISPARVLMRAGLSADYPAHEGRGIEASDWFAVLSALLDEAGDDARAVDLGRAMAAGPLHPALMAFCSSQDIATGIERLATFKPLVAPIALKIGRRAGLFWIEIDRADGMLPLSPQVAVMETAYFVELFRTFCAADITPVEIVLPSLGKASEALAGFAGCRVNGGDGARLVLTEDMAKLPIISADTEVLRAIERELGQRLKASESDASWSDRVDREIRHLLPSGRISVEIVADRLRLSSRSLQRKLQQEGASFQGVLDKTRASLALIYLRDQKLSTEETSYLLAYKDPNSFFRAFNDWTGMTPSEARANR